MAKKILIIEDEDRIVRLLKQGLAAAGYQALSAPNGKTGIHLAKKEKVDLILLDVVMEGMGGFEVLRTLKANRKLREIPVFMLTGRDDPEDIKCGISNLAEKYFTKPFELKQLIESIHKTLNTLH